MIKARKNRRNYFLFSVNKFFICVYVLRVFTGIFVRTADLLNCSLTLFVSSLVDLHVLFLCLQTRFDFKSVIF